MSVLQLLFDGPTQEHLAKVGDTAAGIHKSTSKGRHGHPRVCALPPIAKAASG